LNILDKKSKDAEVSSIRLLKNVNNITLDEFLENVSTVIVDEAHMGKAEVIKKILTNNLKNAPIRWGLTGTIPKEDFEFQSILASLGPVVGSVSAKELQDKGIISNCHVNIMQMVDYPEFKNYQEELKYLTTNSDRLTYIATMINTIAASGNTLILVDRISAGEKLMELIPNAKFIKGDVKLKDRKTAYDEINESSDSIVIATYGVAAVGINIPRIFNLVLFESGKSFVTVIQSIGRGIRRAKDKDFVQIWDITSTCKFAKRHLTQRKKYYKDAQYPFTVEKVDWNNK
jgi:superfamily II DNA or RNA helicase